MSEESEGEFHGGEQQQKEEVYTGERAEPEGGRAGRQKVEAEKRPGAEQRAQRGSHNSVHRRNGKSTRDRLERNWFSNP